MGLRERPTHSERSSPSEEAWHRSTAPGTTIPGRAKGQMLGVIDRGSSAWRSAATPCWESAGGTASNASPRRSPPGPTPGPKVRSDPGARQAPAPTFAPSGSQPTPSRALAQRARPQILGCARTISSRSARCPNPAGPVSPAPVSFRPSDWATPASPRPRARSEASQSSIPPPACGPEVPELLPTALPTDPKSRAHRRDPPVRLHAERSGVAANRRHPRLGARPTRRGSPAPGSFLWRRFNEVPLAVLVSPCGVLGVADGVAWGG